MSPHSAEASSRTPAATQDVHGDSVASLVLNVALGPRGCPTPLAHALICPPHGETPLPASGFPEVEAARSGERTKGLLQM